MNEISRDSHFYCFLNFIIDVLYIISTGGYNCVDTRILVFLLASFIVSLFLLPALAVIRRLNVVANIIHFYSIIWVHYQPHDHTIAITISDFYYDG